MASQRRGKGGGASLTGLWVAEWAEHTCCNGVPNIQRATSTPAKVFWTLLFLGANVGLFWQISESVRGFLAYPVNTRIRISYDTEMSFPALTLCNVNAVKKSVAEAHPVLGSFLNTSFTLGNEGMYKRNFTHLFNALNESEKTSMEHKLEDMVVEAVWQSQEHVNLSDFQRIHNPYYGNCFVWNWGVTDKHSHYVTHKSGLHYGLSLKLYLEVDEYEGMITEAEGMRLYVHERGTWPYPEDEGTYLSAGTVTSVSLRRVDVHRQPSPYPSQCLNLTTNALSRPHDAYASQDDVKYTHKGCYNTCFQRHLIDECGCVDTLYPASGEALQTSIDHYAAAHPNSSLDNCFQTHHHELCEEEVIVKWQSGDLHCDTECFPPCWQVEYDKVISTAMWPNHDYTAHFLEAIKIEKPALAAAINTSQSLRENLLKLELFFEDLNHEIVYEEPALPVLTLLSNLGGTFGLWVGLSLIAVFEFIELFILILISFCYSKKHNKTSETPIQKLKS